jgi:UDP-GlcNAc:undecaprenyl-phosphate/decaprenyl-phosphate GlcNAc-1-phosphate transferase
MMLFAAEFLLALVLTLILTPVTRGLALKLGAVDRPSKRKIHKNIIPRFGGLSIFVSFVVAVVLAMSFSGTFGVKLNFKDMQSLNGILFGGALITLIGLFDDMKGMPALWKLAGQIVAASVAIYFGVQIYIISTPFTKLIMLGFWAIPVTLVWMTAITNAINLIDGLDGLASGITLIAGATLFAVAIKMGQYDSAILLVALAGTAAGFLRYNFFPASIFLGDSGSLFFGFMLACASIVGVLKSTLVIALVIPIVVLGIPIYDTATAIIRRAITGHPIFEADKKHLHHRLMKAGFNQRQVVIMIYIACLILSVAALAAAVFDNYPTLIFLTIFVVLGILALDFAKDILRNITFLNGDNKK